jgi:hypothetical protein
VAGLSQDDGARKVETSLAIWQQDQDLNAAPVTKLDTLVRGLSKPNCNQKNCATRCSKSFQWQTILLTGDRARRPPITKRRLSLLSESVAKLTERLLEVILTA